MSQPTGPQHFPTPDIFKEIFGRPGVPDPKLPVPQPKPEKEKEKA